jgi:predicted TIM-barrel fold metal-dependent hydrolase
LAALASLPETNIEAAATEFERAIALPGIVGAQVPGNHFMTYRDAEAMRPVLDVANRHKAVLFIHYGPRPGDAWPRIAPDTDNVRRRNGTLDMQASLSSNMVTLCLTDFLDPYPDAKVMLHNLGGNIPYEMERMDHRCLLDTPDEELPSARFARAKVYVDCNSFGPHAIEAGVRAYGADRIVFGTDGTAFGGEWTNNAIRDAEIGEEARRKIRHGNAASMLSHLAPIAVYGQAAE